MLRETTQILSDLIAYPTISSDSNLAMIDDLAGRLEAVGARIDVIHNEDGTKANLFASLGPEGDDGIVLSGHTDVVPVTDQNWASDPFTMDERDGLFFGRGSCDMKGFIAATIAMAPFYAALDLKRPLHFAFTYDEETGCMGAQHLAKELQRRNIKPSVAIIGEPTQMRMIEGHKGCNEYSTHFHGLAGHGSAPDLGVNAVEYAVRYVARLLELKDALQSMAPMDSPFEPPWTTVNVGTIKGGEARNVIASKAEVQWEMRPVQQSDADYVKSELHRLCRAELLPKMRAIDPNAQIETEIIGEVEGLIPVDDNEAKKIVAALTGANSADLVSFGTEAGIFQNLGMDVVICGPGSIEQAHKADEYVAADQLSQCLTMLEKLGQNLTQ